VERLLLPPDLVALLLLLRLPDLLLWPVLRLLVGMMV